MEGLPERLQAVAERITSAARIAGRDPASVRLVAVSKTFPAAAVRIAFAAGQRDFGENYVQEALDKMALLAELPIVWHFIGPIQSNKTRSIAEHFHWVHSIDRLKIAERLSAQRPVDQPPLEVCLQVNVSGEATKSGADPAAIAALAGAVAKLPNLRLRGLMTIPEPTTDVALQRARFQRVRELLATAGLPLDTLSMGMSDDLESAIDEGATIVRVGRAIFGTRG
ncbi:MAG: YggS family pyridoxal phosphate-dependent enzyme [Betaproteobacteria bacterium]